MTSISEPHPHLHRFLCDVERRIADPLKALVAEAVNGSTKNGYSGGQRTVHVSRWLRFLEYTETGTGLQSHTDGVKTFGQSDAHRLSARGMSTCAGFTSSKCQRTLIYHHPPAPW